jgi:endonuclease YncB( thermonuclease family)
MYSLIVIIIHYERSVKFFLSLYKKNKLLAKQVRLDIMDIDRYRRMVGIIWIESRNINLEMVKEGYAEAYIEYLKEPYKSEFIKAEREARSAKKGIWSLPEYERPREFRKRLKVRGGLY